MNISVILLLGAIGGLARYEFHPGLIGTIGVNLFGAFAIGMVSELMEAGNVGTVVYTGITTGLLGSLTSFAGPIIDGATAGTHSVIFSDACVGLSVLVAPMVCAVGQGIARRKWWRGRSPLQDEKHQRHGRKNANVLGYRLQSRPESQRGESQT